MAHRSRTEDGTETGPRAIIRAQLSIEPHPEANCAVANAGTDADAVSHHVKLKGAKSNGQRRGFHDDECGECHTDMAYSEDSDQRSYHKSTVNKRCICPIFENHDCIPQIQAVRNGAVIVHLTVPERPVFREVIHDLRAVGAAVSVEWLVRGNEPRKTMELDVQSITDKQREAIEIALDKGYYDTPRGSDLGDLAAELDITESAISQRLNAAETKLVKSFFEEC